MLQNYNEFFIRYTKIRNEIDNISEKLGQKHKRHMKCSSGCDSCCMDYSILPVEFYAIQNEMQQNVFIPDKLVPEKRDELTCSFLKNHICSIYSYRPVICRSHGLPLLFANEDGDWELSACELNFTNFNFTRFNLKNTFPQDTFNSRLFMLNKQFISGFKEKKYGEFDLIPIRKLSLSITNEL